MNSKNIKMRTLSGIIGMTIVFFTACSGGSKGNAITDDVDSSVVVKVLKVAEQPVEQLIELTGNIQPFISNDIAGTIPGRIEKINVEVGDRVQRGQVLVEMDRTNLIQAKIQLQNAEKELSRVEALYKSGSATQQQFDQLTTQLEVARESLRNLEENTVLVSPINGVVTARNFDPKNIYPGAPAILNVMQMNPVKVMISISESYFSSVKQGMEVKIKLDVYKDKVFTGKLELLHPTIDRMTRTFNAEVHINNADMAIRPGMFARVELNFGTQNNIVVPDMAIIRQMGSNNRFVFVVENGIAYQRKVELGRRDGNVYELLSGVENGSQVVVAGQTKLMDGTKVKVQ